MQTTITVKEKSVYGNTLVYPGCDQSQKLASLLNVKTFNNHQLSTIKDLGFEVNLIKLPA
jgi:hypothetical protein